MAQSPTWAHGLGNGIIEIDSMSRMTRRWGDGSMYHVTITPPRSGLFWLLAFLFVVHFISTFYLLSTFKIVPRAFEMDALDFQRDKYCSPWSISASGRRELSSMTSSGSSFGSVLELPFSQPAFNYHSPDSSGDFLADITLHHNDNDASFGPSAEDLTAYISSFDISSLSNVNKIFEKRGVLTESCSSRYSMKGVATPPHQLRSYDLIGTTGQGADRTALLIGLKYEQEGCLYTLKTVKQQGASVEELNLLRFLARASHRDEFEYGAHFLQALVDHFKDTDYLYMVLVRFDVKF